MVRADNPFEGRAVFRRAALALLLAGDAGGAAAATEADAALREQVAQLAARIEKLEQRNRELEQRIAAVADAERRLAALEAQRAAVERALDTDELSELEPKLVTRVKAAEHQVADMQKAASVIESLDGFSAGASLSTVGQRLKGGGADTGVMLNYRADITVTTPPIATGNVQSSLFGHFRIGQGRGVAEALPFFAGPNTSAFELGSVVPPESSAVILAEAWYQAEIPLPPDSPRSLARQTLTVNFGKMDPFAFFDQNAAANDETRQFLASSLVHNALLDNPLAANVGADGFGFSPGVRLAYLNERNDPRRYGFSVGVFGSGQGADFSESIRSPFLIAQVETRQRFFGLEGNYRLYYWRNGQAPTFVPEATATHAGMGLSVDQRVGDAIVLFGRLGGASGADLPFDRTLSLGAEFGGSYWRRAADTLGLGVGANRASGDFRARSAGVLDADGGALYGYAARGSESYAELYYRYRIQENFEITPDLQWIRHPAANPDIGSLLVPGLRLQLTY